MDDDGVVPLDHLCVLDTLVDAAVTLQHLEDGLFIHVVLVLLQERLEADQFNLVLLLQGFLLAWLQLFVLVLAQDVVDFVELQLDDPCAEQQLLRLG